MRCLAGDVVVEIEAIAVEVEVEVEVGRVVVLPLKTAVSTVRSGSAVIWLIVAFVSVSV